MASEIALKYRKALLGDHQDTARSLFDKGFILSQQGMFLDPFSGRLTKFSIFIRLNVSS